MYCFQLFVLCLLCVLLLVPTTTTSFNDNLLPEELKGLKLYEVSDGYGNLIKIAFIKNREVIAESYRSGKTTKHVLVVYEENSVNNIQIKEIISENDSIIVAKKF